MSKLPRWMRVGILVDIESSDSLMSGAIGGKTRKGS